MTLKIGLIVPQGWRMDLVGIADPVEAYETMTHVAQEAEALGYASIWLFDWNTRRHSQTPGRGRASRGARSNSFHAGCSTTGSSVHVCT